MALRIAITDLDGNVVARVGQYEAAKATIEANADRTGEVTIPAEDLGGYEGMKVLERMLQIYYAPPGQANAYLLVFGIIDTPEWKGDKVTVAAKGLGTTRLATAYLDLSDVAIFGDPPSLDTGGVPVGVLPVSATGLRRLVRAAESADGVGPGNHIVEGVVTHPGAFPYAKLTAAFDVDATSRAHTLDTIGFADPAISTGTFKVEFPDGQQGTYNAVFDDGFDITMDVYPGAVYPVGTVIKGLEPHAIKVQRGDPDIWQIITGQVVAHPLGPDIDLAPTDEFVDPTPHVNHPGGDVRTLAPVPDPIPPATSASVDVPLDVADVDVIASTRVSIYVTHTRPADLTVELIAPDLTTLTIWNGPASAAPTARNLGRSESERLVFNDTASATAASAALADFRSGDPEGLSGAWRPAAALSALNGKPTAGTWTLRVTDTVSGHTGTVRRWGIAFNSAFAQDAEFAYAKLHVYDALETEPGGARDKRESVVLQCGWGREDIPLESWSYKPGGDSVRNLSVAVTSGQTGTNPMHRAIAQDRASRDRYGTYTKWQAASVTTTQASTADVLKALAQEEILAYAEPPKFVDFELRGDGQARYYYMRDFKHNEVISVDARFGDLRVSEAVFVQQVVVSQEDQAGETKVKLSVTPDVPRRASVGSGPAV